MRFNINGTAVEVEADIRTSLLDLMRNYLHLTGTKKGCDQGHAGHAPCWWTVSGSTPVSRWPSSIKAETLPPWRALLRMAAFIHCKKPL